jgi:hypothetical protein
MEDTHASTVTVLATEQDAGLQSTDTEEVAPTRNILGRWYIFAGVSLLLLGGAGIYATYSRYLINVTPVVVAPKYTAPIFVESVEQVQGSGSALMQAVAQEVQKPIGNNTVRQLVSSATSTNANNIFFSLGIPVPGILLRNINSEGNMAGVVNNSDRQSPFFILSVDLYSATFSGMLAWEPAMQHDLQALFPILPDPVAATPIATTTVASTTPLSSPKPIFHDEVVSNHDVRILRDTSGRSVLVYGYWNPTTLVIARDTTAFGEILNRLATSHAQ